MSLGWVGGWYIFIYRNMVHFARTHLGIYFHHLIAAIYNMGGWAFYTHIHLYNVFFYIHALYTYIHMRQYIRIKYIYNMLGAAQILWWCRPVVVVRERIKAGMSLYHIACMRRRAQMTRQRIIMCLCAHTSDGYIYMYVYVVFVVGGERDEYKSKWVCVCVVATASGNPFAGFILFYYDAT